MQAVSALQTEKESADQSSDNESLNGNSGNEDNMTAEGVLSADEGLTSSKITKSQNRSKKGTSKKLKT
jgi:uncharacterized protein YdaL